MSLVARSGCVPGKEEFVELALREAMSTPIPPWQSHGSSQAGSCPLLLRRRQGCHRRQRSRSGFHPKLFLILGRRKLEAEHGRGIHLMKLAMDEVSFERGGTEVTFERNRNEEKTATSGSKRIVRRSVDRPWAGVRAVELV